MSFVEVGVGQTTTACVVPSEGVTPLHEYSKPRWEVVSLPKKIFPPSEDESCLLESAEHAPKI